MRHIFLTLALLLSTACFGKGRYDASIIGPMDGESLAGTLQELVAAEGPEVTLRINSPGGEAITTLLFIDLVRDVKEAKGLHITCVGTGMVASAAAVVMESKVCDVRVLEAQTVFLFHNGSLSGAGGKAEQMEDDLALIRVLNRAMAAIVAPRIGMTVDAYLAWIGDRDRWLSPEVCKELGIVDEVRW